MPRMNKVSSRALLLTLLTTCLLCISTLLRAEVARVTGNDFASLGNSHWSGMLRYLDYGSATQRQIPVEVAFETPSAGVIIYRIRYPGEEQYNQRERLTWSDEGDVLNDRRLISRVEEPDGGLTLVTEHRGEDDDRPALIRMRYHLEATTLTFSKLVRFADSEAFFERNAYVLQAAPPAGGLDGES